MLTDEQLMERLKKGDGEPLDELYGRYSRKLYAFCYSMTRSGDTEDLVHDVFMRVIKEARGFKEEKASFRTWIYRIARNRCIDFTRRGSKFRPVPIEGESERDDGADAEESAARASVMEAVRGCIDELENEQEKSAVVLYYLEDKVYREIGGILGKSISMVKKRLKAAQEKIKRCLERKGIGSSP